MKTKSENKTIIRVKREDGKYTTISRAVLMNPKLRDSSKTLIQLLLNNHEDWTIVLEYYRNKLGWSKNKLSGAVANLIQEGYLIKLNNYDHENKKNHYYFVVSEYGNLNKTKEVSIEIDDEVMEQVTEISNEVASITDSDSELLLIELVENTITKATECLPNDDYKLTIFSHYANKLDAGEFTLSNFNPEKVQEVIRARIIKKFKPIIEQSITSGTKHQREVILKKGIEYLTNAVTQGKEISESIIKGKMMGIKTSVINANRVIDPRYND